MGHMPDAEVAKVARRVQGWGRAHGDAWWERLEREEAERARAIREAEESRAAREAEEEERAREAKEAAAARDKNAVGEGKSERGEEVEVRGGPREEGDDEEGSAGGATAEKARGSDGGKTTQAASQPTATGSADPGASAKQDADGGKEVGEVEIEEVEGVKLGPVWDARDPSRRLGSGEVQVSLFRFVLFLNFTNQSSFIFQGPTRPCALCVKKGRECIMDLGYRACRGCTNSHLGCSLVPTSTPSKPVKARGSKAAEKGEKTGDTTRKAALASKDTRSSRAKATQLVIGTSYERDSGKGKGKEKEGERPAQPTPRVVLKAPKGKRAVEEAERSIGGEVIEIIHPRKKAKARRAPSVSLDEEDGAGLEEALSELRVTVGAMAGLAENFVATARLLGRSVERLEKEVKKRR
jgi:hypothetical protein